jgi:hypothetical protein
MSQKARPRQQKEAPLCVYCERRPATTRDHVIPRSFFHVLPQNMITVPVCKQCNHEKSEHEAYVRDFLTVDLYGHEHPQAKALFEGKVQRSIQYKSSDLAQDARATHFPVPIFTPKGQYLGERTGILVEKARVEVVLTMMVRGLLYHLQKQRIPQDYVITVNLIEPTKVVETVQYVASLPHESPLSWGDQVCECIFVQAGDNPATTMWLLRFYRGVMFLVDTSPEGME